MDKINNSSDSNVSIKVTENVYNNSKSNVGVGEQFSANARYNNSRNGNTNDYVNENETEGNEENLDNDERQTPMQTNPNTDYYNDEDESVYSDTYDSDEEDEPELLPEAKELVQLPSKERRVLDDDEEEDMGYDEDDERIAIAVERPKELRSHNNDFSNDEGSGSYESKRLYNSHAKHVDHRLGSDYMNSFGQKQQKLFPDHSNSQVGVVATEVDLRESSGNFANDDEDNDDESDDDDDSDGFFNAKRRSNGRYFRKNTNDAIKIISTPLGKVGIVYQQSGSHANDKNIENSDKKSTSFTDFDALSPDPESSHRLASSHPKITPVLTPDGKVALLYRGDSENSKYEPIRNITTHKLNKVSDHFQDKKKINSLHADSSDSSEYSDADSMGDTDDEADIKTSSHNNNVKNNIDLKMTTEEEQAAILPAPDAAPTTGSFIIRPTDSVLPMINRPLSEVLGIKKNQFKQFRIKDSSSTTEGTSGSLSALNVDNSETNTLHYLTKVNLADYPTSSRTRNYDFDFSRDNTMLDERSRGKEYQIKTDMNSNQQTVDNNDAMTEDILSKTEVVNLAIVPHFDEELERLQRLREYEERRHNRQRHRQKQNDEDLSGIHCIMQAMMGIAAISTVFGMLGTFFKQRILDQLRLMHW